MREDFRSVFSPALCLSAIIPMSAPSASVSEYLRKHSFTPLLIALVVMIIAAPFAGKLGNLFSELGPQASIAPFVLLLTVAAGSAVWPYAKHRIWGISLGALVLLLLYFSTFSNQQSLTVTHLAGQAIFFVYVLLIVGRAVFQASVIDGNILCGAACIYLLIGVLFGFAYSLIEAAFPGSFHIADFDTHTHLNSHELNPGWMIYFSFSTLTTVCFGDMLPASELTRSFAALEAVTGQMSLVVMIARLVGLHVAQTTSGRRKITIGGPDRQSPHRRRKGERHSD